MFAHWNCHCDLIPHIAPPTNILLDALFNPSCVFCFVFADALTSFDLVDLAVEAVYRLYQNVLRDESVLEKVLTHSVQKVITRSFP